MLKEEIIYKPSCPYSQEQNGVLEQMGCTIIDMARATIIGRSIQDNFWPKIVLAMVHVKNIRLTSILDRKNPYELFESKPPTIDHLQVLGSTVYVLIPEANCSSKSTKFALRAQQGQLVEYNRKTIYQMFLEGINESVIRVKDLSIYEDATPKENTKIFYNAVQVDTRNNEVIDANSISLERKVGDLATGTGTLLPALKRKQGRPQKVTAETIALITMLSEILSKPQ